MARRKSSTAAQTTTQSEEPLSGTEQQLQEGAHDQQGAQAEHAAASSRGPEESGDGQARRFIRDTFTSTRAGVRAGEDKRFNAPQVFIDFADDKRATPEEKADMSEAGFRYRPKDKGYSALATADTRQARDELAQKFTDRRLKEKAGQDEGPKR